MWLPSGRVSSSPLFLLILAYWACDAKGGTLTLTVTNSTGGQTARCFVGIYFEAPVALCPPYSVSFLGSVLRLQRRESVLK